MSTRALRAAVEVAEEHGLPFSRPVVLRDRSNLLVRFEPLSVGARVARLTATVRHGDAHLGNVINTGAGPLWNDWEDTMLAPRAWDLGCLHAAALAFGRDPGPVAAAQAGYGEGVDDEALDAFVAARTYQASVWTLVLHRRVNPPAPPR